MGSLILDLALDQLQRRGGGKMSARWGLGGIIELESPNTAEQGPGGVKPWLRTMFGDSREEPGGGKGAPGKPGIRGTKQEGDEGECREEAFELRHWAGSSPPSGQSLQRWQ